MSIEYKGKTYNFEHKNPVIYGYPFKLLFQQITPDVIDMMEDIILNSDKLIKIQSIPEPIL